MNFIDTSIFEQFSNPILYQEDEWVSEPDRSSETGEGGGSEATERTEEQNKNTYR